MPLEHPHLSEGTDHDALRFQIAMDDPVGVRERDRFTGAQEHAQSFTQRPILGDECVEPRAPHQLHRVEDLAVSSAR